MRKVLLVLALVLAISCENHEKQKPIIFSGTVEHKMNHRGNLVFLVKKDSVVVEVPVTKEQWDNVRYHSEVKLDTVRDEYTNRIKYVLVP